MHRKGFSNMASPKKAGKAKSVPAKTTKKANKKKVRIAAIGAGGMANGVHYPSLADFNDVELVGLCDMFPDKLAATAEKFGFAQTFSDYKKMLDETQPDAVYILMPPYHLFDLTVECLKRGHGVFVEKPLGVTSGQAQSLARLAEKNNCPTMVGFQRRFCPLLIESKKRVEARGQILQCLARFVKSGGTQPYYNGAIDILTCDVIHAVDILRWMSGEVKKVSSTVDAFGGDVENAFNALMEFENGAVGMLLSNWVTGRRIYATEMHALNITALSEPDDRAIIYADGDETGETLISSEVAGSDEMHKKIGFYGENRHFIDCLKNGKLPETHFGDALKTMELVDRIYASQL
jgi:predicted dehydrogenase